jgi:hypothetical protein
MLAGDFAAALALFGLIRNIGAFAGIDFLALLGSAMIGSSRSAIGLVLLVMFMPVSHE